MIIDQLFTQPVFEAADPSRLIVSVRIEPMSTGGEPMDKEVDLTGQFQGSMGSQMNQALDYMKKMLESKGLYFTTLRVNYQGKSLGMQNRGSMSPQSDEEREMDAMADQIRAKRSNQTALPAVKEEAPMASPEQLAYNRLRAQHDGYQAMTSGGGNTAVSRDPAHAAKLATVPAELARMAAALKAKGIDAKAEYDALGGPKAAPVDANQEYGGMKEGRKKKNKKTLRSLGRYFFPGFGYYGSGESGEGGGDGGGESANPGMAEGSDQQLSVRQLATISDEALDKAYGYGRSSPGNTFGWQANLKSAAYAKHMIDKGVTDINEIADAIHKGWNVTAKAFVKNPNRFDDTEKLKAAGKLEAKLQQRAKLMNIDYSQLPDDEQEKDRVVARALLQAITGGGEQNMSEGEYDSRKPFGVRYKVFAGREGRVTTREYWTSSEQKLQRAVAKIEALDNFYEIDGYSYPKEQQGVAEDTTDDLLNMRRDDPRIKRNQDITALAKEIYAQMVAERGQPMDRRQQQTWMAIAQTKAAAQLSNTAPQTQNDVPAQRPLPALKPLPGEQPDSFIRKSSTQWESQGVAEGQLNELSTGKLAQYKTAAAKDAKQADQAGDVKRGDKRFGGIVKATKKQFDNDAKKIDESRAARQALMAQIANSR